ncbi:MAG: hypothetical protein KG029_07525 [Bacteroidetes bacterium]|nr:hypothetical protein [Bacteroidota bacterium]
MPELPKVHFNRRLKLGFKNQKTHINGKLSRENLDGLYVLIANSCNAFILWKNDYESKIKSHVLSKKLKPDEPATYSAESVKSQSERFHDSGIWFSSDCSHLFRFFIGKS